MLFRPLLNNFHGVYKLYRRRIAYAASNFTTVQYRATVTVFMSAAHPVQLSQIFHCVHRVSVSFLPFGIFLFRFVFH